MASDKTVHLCKLKYDTVTYREIQNNSLLLFKKNNNKNNTHLHKTKFKRHSKLFNNYLTSEFSSSFQGLFRQIISDFRVFAFASRSASSSLCISFYLSRWISVCVSPRLSSWWVDSCATWGKVFSSFSQVSSSRLGTTNHTLYREPVLLFPDMFTTPPWTYIQPACRRICEEITSCNSNIK